jgi:ERCC4-type nuclease
MFLKIDVREHDLYEKCVHLTNTIPQYKDLKIIKENLPLGDLIIVDDLTNDEIIIIERKSLTDLEASIKDGRYEEQSYRLQGSHVHNHNIVYLVEGDVSKVNPFKRSLNKMMIYSSIFSLNYYKGFSVLKTVSLDESAMLVCNMVYKMNKEKDKTPYYSLTKSNLINDELKDDTNNELKDYCDVIKKVKKENINEGNIGQIMLSQIPGISSVTAKAILEPFNTLPNLVISLQKDQNCLEQIYTKDSNGKSRKISKTVIKSLQKYLLSSL